MSSVSKESDLQKFFCHLVWKSHKICPCATINFVFGSLCLWHHEEVLHVWQNAHVYRCLCVGVCVCARVCALRIVSTGKNTFHFHYMDITWKVCLSLNRIEQLFRVLIYFCATHSAAQSVCMCAYMHMCVCVPAYVTLCVRRSLAYGTRWPTQWTPCSPCRKPWLSTGHYLATRWPCTSQPWSEFTVSVPVHSTLPVWVVNMLVWFQLSSFLWEGGKSVWQLNMLVFISFNTKSSRYKYFLISFFQ